MHDPKQPPFEQPYIDDVQMDEARNQQYMHNMCKQYHLHFVQIQTSEGQLYDGIIDDVDNEGVTLLAPYGDMDQQNYDPQRQFGYGYGAGYGYGFPRRFRRFRRFRFPFFRLRNLFFPFFY